MRAKRGLVLALILASSFLGPAARGADRPFQVVLHVRAGFADQALADQRIDRINDRFRSDLESWGHPTVLELDAQLWRQVSPGWSIGVQAGYGRAAVNQSVTDESPTGNKVVLEQESDLVQFMAVGRRSLCASCSRLDPFVLGGAGVGYGQGSIFLEANPTSPHPVYNHLRLERGGFRWRRWRWE